MSIPNSPSSRQLKHSPTSPSYSEFQYKRNLLDEVKTWSENKVSDWLQSQSLGRYGPIFIGKIYIYIWNKAKHVLYKEFYRTQYYGFSITRFGLRGIKSNGHKDSWRKSSTHNSH